MKPCLLCKIRNFTLQPIYTLFAAYCPRLEVNKLSKKGQRGSILSFAGHIQSLLHILFSPQPFKNTNTTQYTGHTKAGCRTALARELQLPDLCCRRGTVRGRLANTDRRLVFIQMLSGENIQVRISFIVGSQLILSNNDSFSKKQRFSAISCCQQLLQYSVLPPKKFMLTV